MVEGSRSGRQSLVSKVFDVHSGASPLLLPGSRACDTEIHVPWGAGILGYVADTGETVNLQVACEVSDGGLYLYSLSTGLPKGGSRGMGTYHQEIIMAKIEQTKMLRVTF